MWFPCPSFTRTRIQLTGDFCVFQFFRPRVHGALIFPFPLRVPDGGIQLYPTHVAIDLYVASAFDHIYMIEILNIIIIKLLIEKGISSLFQRGLVFEPCCFMQVRSSVVENVPLQSRKATVCDGSSLGGQLKAAACTSKVFLNIYSCFENVCPSKT